ncbi:hypothetical protein ACS0TY_025202 [Phlomoides rotata]
MFNIHYQQSRRKMQVVLKREVIIGDWIHQLLRTTEILDLQGEGSNKLVPFLPEFQSLKRLEQAVGTHFPLLEFLSLRGMYDLEEIHKGPISSNSFSNLQQLLLASLPKLQHLGNDFLLRLKKLTIRSCSMLEQVVLWNEEEHLQSSRISFPKLEELSLYNLPRLTSFSRGIQIIEFPLLTAIRIEECRNLKNLVCSTGSGHNKCSGAMKHDDDDSLHFFCKSKVAFGRLKKLIFDGSKISRLWCDQISMDIFTGLVDMTVRNCDNIKSLFSLSIATYLVNLESLEIKSCSMIEQVVLLWDEEESEQSSRNHRRITFPKLKTLCLQDLPRLTSFCKGIQTIQFPLLKMMEIMNCPNLKSLVSSTENDKRCSGAINHDDDDDSFHLFCKSQVAFGRLDEVEIHGYDSISSLWCDKIPMEFFTGLVELNVSNCGNIESLFSLSIARNLVNLRNLSIRYCSEMVKVVEDKFDEFERCPFNNLKYLRLVNLPKMNVFCDGRCFRELALQRKVHIQGCPEMERFHSP